MEAAVPVVRREPWNKGKIVGQKAPFKPKEIWALRVRLQMESSRSEYSHAVAQASHGAALPPAAAHLPWNTRIAPAGIAGRPECGTPDESLRLACASPVLRRECLPMSCLRHPEAPSCSRRPRRGS